MAGLAETLSHSLPCETGIITKPQLARHMQQVRREGARVPVLIGVDEDVERLAEACALAEQSFDEIMQAADRIDVEAFFKAREAAWRHRHRGEAEAIVQKAGQDPASFQDEIGRDIIADYKRMLKDGGFRENSREEVAGQWPLRHQPAPDLLQEQGSWSYAAWPQLGEVLQPPSRRHVALMPVREDAAAFALFHFGGWNDSPSPAEHVAVFRHWSEQYDLELFQLDDYRMHCTVGAPPETRDEALELAWQQFFYSPRLLDHGPRHICELASLLLGGKSWAFWWD